MSRHLTVIVVAALGLLLVACASSGPVRERIKERMDARQQPDEVMDGTEGPAGPVALPAGARVVRDLAYGPDPKQRMDVYLPQRASGPVLFVVHGGAWRVGDKAATAVVQNKVAHWLPQGVIVVSTNYRLSPKADPLEQANDVARALAAAQSRAKDWSGDPGRFVLLGHSAGAHLVALLAADPAIAGRQDAGPWLGTIALDSAAFDIVEIMQRRHYRFYDRVFKSDPAYWRESSPTHRLAGAGAPMLIVCSTRRTDACPQARGFATRATAMGRAATVLPVALTHQEINKNLGLEGEYTKNVESFLRSLGVGAH